NYHLRESDSSSRKKNEKKPKPKEVTKNDELIIEDTANPLKKPKLKEVTKNDELIIKKTAATLKSPKPDSPKVQIERRPIVRQFIEKDDEKKQNVRNRSPLDVKKSLINVPYPRGGIILQQASARSKNIYNVIKSRHQQLSAKRLQVREFRVEYHKKITLAFACITMFLIGAPLGAIIKKGGLGIPVLISVVFFITFYVLSITGEKWVKEDLVTTPIGMWMSNAILLVFGLFFLRQARNDSRLLEADFYFVIRDQLFRRWSKKS
ncbi:MAG: LptF/LptG family permease, partial [Bacteroidota bacterium]